MKQCSLCGQFKDVSQFARRNDGKGGGFQSHCLTCQSEKNKRNYEARQTVLRERSRLRKAAIKAGTHQPSASGARYERRRADLPPPKPVEHVVAGHLDANEYQFLLEIADERGVRMELILRELVRAAMAARASTESKKEAK